MRIGSTVQRKTAANSPVFWVVLAVMTLVLAGALALALVVGRAPVVSAWIDDPSFFRRALVVHVVLSLWGWFMAYAAGLRSLVDGPGHAWRRVTARVLATGGVAAMVGSAAIRGAEPLLVNYIPVVDHPLFLWGLALFFGGVGLELCRIPRACPAEERSIPAASAIAWRSTAPVAVLGLVVFALSWWMTPRGIEGEPYYELLFWGVGHTLQVVSVLVMVGAWFYLLRDQHGRSPVGTKTSLAISAALVLPWLIAPVLTLGGTTDATYLRGFTRLMQFGIAGPVVVAILLCISAWGRADSRAGRWAFATSAALTVIGFGLGAMIRGSDTMIPAHYHASLGAITVALMALTYALATSRGWAPHRRWWRRCAAVQPVVFGGGQLIFAAGFALSGIFGAGRKTYGADQIIDSTGALVGLATMGIGGVAAVVGGAGFLILIAVACKEHFLTMRRTG